MTCAVFQTKSVADVRTKPHEIRNPLSAVQMNFQILKKNPELKGNDQKRVDISVREVKRLEKIL